MIYAVTPYTVDKYDPQLPAGVQDYGNDNLDRFAGMLRKGGDKPDAVIIFYYVDNAVSLDNYKYVLPDIPLFVHLL